GDNYLPTTYKNPRAPINGLYRSSSLFSPNNAGFHGYSLSAFAYYLSKRYDWKAHFWHTVFSHADYAAGKGIAPLKAGANSMSILGLDYLYHVFLRNYLSDGVSDAPSGKMPFGSNSQRSLTIFQNTDQNEVDWMRFPQNGKISKIEKTSDLSGKLEQEFQIQDLGAATWLFTFPKPKEVIKEGMYARVRIDEVCSDLFAVLFKGPEGIGITKIEGVDHDEDKKVRVLDFSLASLENSDRLMNIGLVAVNANSSTGDSPEIHPAKMTVLFLGLITLPPETTWFNLWGERIQQASADLEITCDTTGVLGEYSVDIWNGGTDILSDFRIVTTQLDKPFPQSIRIRSNIVPVDLGEVHGLDNTGYPFTTHAVPTENAKVFIDFRQPGAEDFYASQEFVVPLADLASEGGYDVNLAPVNPTDEVNITIRPIYTVTGAGSGTGENLNTMVLIFLPPPPPPPAP
ncbi:MAG: hypothetical protein PHY82_11725, partial [Lentisphaeria bacterium]|nr:hypothetical protein [Lentisphaeria bacterium]